MRMRPASLRSRCSVGYRDVRIIELARMFARGEIDPAWYEDPTRSDEEIRDALVELPGVGPYAAANILQLLGRYGHLPLDTESVRHGRTVLGFTGTARAVMKRVQAHFKPFGAQIFRSYWIELWDHYERRKTPPSPAWTWEKDAAGRTFVGDAN
jgi:3-methyladenine DNA glycosylase/8-oxoguanine DNA glycosylase